MLYISPMLKSISLILITLCFHTVYAQDSLIVTQKDSVIVDSLEVINDPVIDQWDSLVTVVKTDPSVLYLDSSVYKLFRQTPTYTDEEYMEMMDVLDNNSPFKLDYNKRVRQSINYYVKQGRAGTSKVLGKSKLYFPMMEEILNKNGLPLEFKYLSIVESALNPRARSRGGATGLWQFMYGTGKENGLLIDSYVDERMDPIKSTEAACKYLSRLYKIYGDWNLVLAAYNSGPGNVNKAIRRSGGSRDFWEIKQYLPKETRGYVPSFIAVNFAFNYADKFNIFPIKPGLTYADVDTIHVKEHITFDHLKLFLEISTTELEYLNPVYFRNIIPKSELQQPITLPRELIGDFIEHEQEMYSLNPRKISKKKMKEELLADKNVKGYTYKVKGGDVLGVIAEKHNVSVSSLRAWNNIRGNKIYPGQKLIIKSSIRPKSSTTASATKAITVGDKRYHTVQRGDTLWDIAKLYSGVSVSDIKKLNYNINYKKLKPGQKIVIGG